MKAGYDIVVAGSETRRFQHGFQALSNVHRLTTGGGGGGGGARGEENIRVNDRPTASLTSVVRRHRPGAAAQGLTLLHLSAQRKRLMWDKEGSKGIYGGAGGGVQAFRGCFKYQKRLRLG